MAIFIVLLKDARFTVPPPRRFYETFYTRYVGLPVAHKKELLNDLRAFIFPYARLTLIDSRPSFA